MIKRSVFVLLAGCSACAFADPLPANASFTTLALTDLQIEGLTADRAGNLYTTGRATHPALCPVWRIGSAAPSSPPHPIVGFIPNNPAPNGCNPSGITFDEAGNLYIADAASGGTVWTLTPNESTRPTATAFATRVPGTNGLAFDRDGNLWTGDGTTGQGRVWKISSSGANCQTETGCREMFRIQPMRNGTDLGGQLSGRGVGRENRTVPTENAQNLVANGLAFNHEGDLYIADTARGAIWKAQFTRSGELKNAANCDGTFATGKKTLCLDGIFVAHPYLEGTDGIALDRAGNIWNSANERNAIVVVTPHGRVIEVFRNPPNSALLRNSADPAVGNDHILETPTSPFLVGTKFCTANSDGNRRDNSPNTAGEINSSNEDEEARGKISCMDQDLTIPGLPLPVR
jgi:sugar lactone lactonase YvrE